MASAPDSASQVPANPIPDHPRYTMARFFYIVFRTNFRLKLRHQISFNVQLAYVNRGRHGFVVRALDKLTSQEVAIKFLERSTVSVLYRI